MNATRAAISLVILTMLAGSVVGQAGQRWLDPNASVRRVISCEPAAAGLPGDDIGVVTFYTGGLTAKGAKDVRVFAVAAEPRLVAHRVIMEGPGDRLRVAFATPKGVRKYHVYYGNPQAEQPGTSLDIRRGLLYEVRTGEAANAGNVNQIRRAFDRAKPQGTAFVENVFFGFNPFGPSEGYISRFTGYLNIRQPGQYRVATTSDDCSFVLIDDRLVVQWGGTHGAVADARHNAPVMLSTGLHKLEYWHAQGGGGTVAELAWRPPGRPRFVVIPKEAFSQVAFAATEGVQIKGGRIGPDFYADRAGESFHNDFYPVRMTFDNQTSPADAPNMTYRWDFGDGQTSQEKSPSHVYLRHGTYRVRLAVTWGPQKAQLVNRVVVERNWWKQAMNKIEPLRPYAAQVATYDNAKLDAASLANAANLFAKVRNNAERIKVLETLVFTARDVPDRQMLDRTLELAGLYRKGGRHGDAVKAYRRAEAQLASSKRKAVVAVAGARVLLDDLDLVTDADKELRRARKQYAGAPAAIVRQIHVGVGDVACRHGDTDAAMAAYRKAETIPVGGLASKNPTLRISALARYVEEYVRTKDFDSAEEFLRIWYNEFPSHRVGGQAPIMEARLRFAQERYREVLQVADELIGINRDSVFAPETLRLAAEAALKLDRTDDARKALAQIVDDYPESQQHKGAAEMLRKLGGPLAAPGGN